MSYVEQLISAVVSPFQSLEDALQQLFTNRNVYTAVGVVQDIIGDIVGQPRNGLDDVTYTRYLLARIATNRSRGTYEDLITIATLVCNNLPPLGSLLIWNEGTATVRVFPQVPINDALAAILYGFLSQAVTAGVRIVVEWSTVPIATDFRLDSGPGLDVGILASSVG